MSSKIINVEPISIGSIPGAPTRTSSSIVDYVKSVPLTPPKYDPRVAKFIGILRDLGVDWLKLEVDSVADRLEVGIGMLDGGRVVWSITPKGVSVLSVRRDGSASVGVNYNPEVAGMLAWYGYTLPLILLSAGLIKINDMSLSTTPEPLSMSGVLSWFRDFGFLVGRVPVFTVFVGSG